MPPSWPRALWPSSWSSTPTRALALWLEPSAPPTRPSACHPVWRTQPSVASPMMRWWRPTMTKQSRCTMVVWTCSWWRPSLTP
eukprot:78683-Pelagomonas_calceolata.AAC.1